MRKFKKAMALLCAMTLLVTCAIAGLALPAAAAGDTFKLMYDELYLAPKDSGGYIVYGASPALNPDGTPYEGTLTWSSSDKTVATVGASTGRIATVSANKGGTGTTIITATNEAGESHSCTVHVVFDGECISGGDFEAADATGMYSLNRWTPIISSSKAKIVEEADGNHCLEIPAGMAACYYGSLTSLPSTKYLVSFDIKGDTGEIKPMYISNSTANGWKYATPKADGWKHYSWTYTVKSSVNRSYQVALANQNISSGTNTNPIYIDNFTVIALGTAESIALSATDVAMEIGDESTLSVTAAPEGATMNRVTWTSSDEQVATVDKNGKITAVGAGTATITAKSGILDAVTCTVTVYEEMLAAVPDTSLQNGAIETDGVFGEVEAEDVVTVTVTPDEGYLMVPGSLRYTMKDGTLVRVLNKDFTDGATFGQGDGNTFQLVMPNEKVTLTADFIPVSEQNFAANTIGTSCRYTVDENEEKVYDGIRFLTRLNLANKFDAASGTLTVTYGGAEYTVLEFGSLLKREQNVTKLTYENALENSSATGADRMWISRAYTKDSGNFVLVDYTENYLDFTSVMLTKYYDRFYTARGYIRLQAADESVVTLEFDEITNSISSVVPILPPVQALEGATVGKTCWTPITHTVEPNWKITYELTVKAGAVGGPVTVFEPIPANTTYVEGADRLVGKTAVWELELAANETKTLTYTVRVNNDVDLYNGGTVESTATQIGSTTVESDHTLYIERSVSKYDEYFVNQAVKALGDSQFTDLKLVYWTYYVAYSNSIADYSTDTAATLLNNILAGTDTRLDNVAPTLYGGTAVSGPIEGIKGAPATSVSENDLMIGDMLLVRDGGVTSIYLYCDKGLMKVRGEGGFEAADVALLATLTSKQAYAVVRPRASFTKTTSTDPEAPSVELDARQEAVIKTGEAFLLRGDKVQYDDTDFGNPSSSDYRWHLHLDSPEDASYEHIKYTNCAAFCNDSYYFGMGYALPGNMHTTFNMVNATASGKTYASIRKLSVVRSVTDTHTEEEAEQLYNEFMRVIQPGDLMIVLRDTDGNGTDDSGHVMMYIGNEKMIHSGGGNYNFNTGVDTIEPSIRYGQTKDYFFDPTSSNFIYGTRISKFAVIRPLDLTSMPEEVPENTVNRLNNLTGIVAQKYASVRPGYTLNGGESITYTFDIRNTTNEAKTLTVTDTVPANTVYVSGAEVIDGDAMSWTVTVPADGKISFSYTVTVAEDAPAGTEIASVATIGGVTVDCPALTVDNTLTETEQAAIVAAFNELKAEGTTLTGISLVNEIYKRAGIVDVAFADTEYDTIANGENGLLVPTAVSGSYQRYKLAEAGNAYRDMIAPGLYGGMYLDSPMWEADRTQLAYHDDLVVGDVVIGRYTSGYSAYIYLGGDHLVSLSTLANDSKTVDDRLEYIPCWRYFYAVLRPSLTLD